MKTERILIVDDEAAIREMIAIALDLAGFEARVVELSWFGDQIVPLSLGGAFHSRRLSILSSQVGHVATAQRATVTRAQRMEYALSLLHDPALDCLISGESRFDTLPTLMPRLVERPGVVLCHRIAYP